MTQYDVLKLTREVCELIACGKLNACDIRHVEMYEEYMRLVSEGHKHEWIVSYICEQYNIKRRTLFYIRKRMTQDIPY